MASRNVFPWFDGGDVVIALHEETLRLHSGFLKSIAPEFFGPRLSAESKYKSAKYGADGRPAEIWHFFLSHGNVILDQTTHEHDEQRNEESVTDDLFHRSQACSSVLYALYGREFRLDISSMEALIAVINNVLEVAEHMECAAAVAPRIELTLLALNQELYTQIADDPVTWINVGMTIHSFTIVKEAMIHIVGRWHDLEFRGGTHTKLGTGVRKLVMQKYAMLEEAKKRMELHLANYYPDRCKVTWTGNANEYTRSSYANKVYDWVALAIFRGWFSEAIINGRGYSGLDGGYTLYKTIKDGGSGYLDETYLQGRFWSLFAMTGKGKNAFKRDLELLKEDMQARVRPVFRSELVLALESYPISHFTCVPVSKDEINAVWESEDAMESVIKSEPDSDRPSSESGLFVSPRRSFEKSSTPRTPETTSRPQTTPNDGRANKRQRLNKFLNAA